MRFERATWSGTFLPIGAIQRLDPEDWNATGIDQNAIDHIQQVIARWLQELAE